MTSKYYTINFAQAYGQDSYGDCQYNDTTACTTSGGGNTGGGDTGAGTGGASGGQLTDTGFAIVAIVTLAAVLMLVAIVVRVWRRSAKKLAPENATASNDNDLQR